MNDDGVDRVGRKASNMSAVAGSGIVEGGEVGEGGNHTMTGA